MIIQVAEMFLNDVAKNFATVKTIVQNVGCCNNPPESVILTLDRNAV